MDENASPTLKFSGGVSGAMLRPPQPNVEEPPLCADTGNRVSDPVVARLYANVTARAGTRPSATQPAIFAIARTSWRRVPITYPTKGSANSTESYGRVRKAPPSTSPDS